MVDEGCKFCFMEASSHAIHQNRVSGLKFKGAIFTNITHDHLDYHNTFDDYILAKKELFDSLPSDAFALVNKDDRHGLNMLHHCEAKQYTYALKSSADFKAKIIEHQFDGMLLNINGKFDVSKSDEGVQISVKQFGSIKDRYFFEHKLGGYDYSLWDVGNEHAVFLKFSNESDCLLFEHPFNSFDKLEEGRLESHFKSTKLYPEGINVGLAVIGDNWIQLKVWERGCGWTEACSSGAVAAFLAANSLTHMQGEVKVIQAGGLSTIQWSLSDRSIDLCLRPRFVGRLKYEVKR